MYNDFGQSAAADVINSASPVGTHLPVDPTSEIFQKSIAEDLFDDALRPGSTDQAVRDKMKNFMVADIMKKHKNKASIINAYSEFANGAGYRIPSEAQLAKMSKGEIANRIADDTLHLTTSAANQTMKERGVSSIMEIL